jgi:hypothetical protein
MRKCDYQELRKKKSAFIEILSQKSRDFPFLQIHLSDEQEK